MTSPESRPQAGPVDGASGVGTDPAAWDAFVAANDPGSYLQLSGWATVKAVNGWAATRSVVDAPDGPIGAQILVRRPSGIPWGFAYAPRGPVATAWTPDGLHAFTDHVRHDLPAQAGRIATLRIDPEIEIDAGQDADGAVRNAPDRGRLASGLGRPARRHADHRPGARGRGAVGRPAQEVAAVREQGPHGRDRRRRCRG